MPAYVPLARKWRPRAFADVVGQDEIVRALTNAVSADRLAHAYLFSGPRGVGKTTTARLLAAAINCSSSDRPTATPCGTCASCVEVLEGRSLDTLEIDGATHGKVDQARDLIEVVAYAPSRDRRKVFIIDEVHAISSAAFQALLKTLEEPPSHAVFILATTERHKIPATILSRCQRFDFRRLTDDEVTGRLADIASREGFEVVDAGQEAKGKKPVVERAALAALAAAATGSLRDGLSLFDQAAARSGVGVKAEDVAALLGAPDRTALVALLGAVLASDRIGVFKSCAELEAAGAEPRATLHDLTALVRGAVRLAVDPAALPPTGLSEEGAERVREFARTTPYATLLRLLSLLSESDGTLRRSDVPALAFEVLLLKLAELPRLVPIEEILAGRIPESSGQFGTGGGTAPGGGAGGFSAKGNLAAERSASGSRATSTPVAPPHSPSKKTPDIASAPPMHGSAARETGSVPIPSSPSKKTTDDASAPPKHGVGKRPGSPSEAEDPSSSEVPRFVGLTPLEIVPDRFDDARSRGRVSRGCREEALAARRRPRRRVDPARGQGSAHLARPAERRDREAPGRARDGEGARGGRDRRAREGREGDASRAWRRPRAISRRPRRSPTRGRSRAST